MQTTRYTNIFQYMDKLELAICLQFNRFSQWKNIESFFAVISRLGDGVFWYLLMVIFSVVDYPYGLLSALHMALASLLGLYIYKFLKSHTVRERPSVKWSQIKRGAAALDLYSFPSGHTLHAFSFGIIALYYYPGLIWFVAPMMALIALSRLVLGLHYLSDVLAGAAIGTGIAILSLTLI